MAAYLVTGGAGFIGSHMVEELVRRGERVRVVDSLVTGSLRNLAAVASSVEFIQGDLADAAVARQAVAGMEYVLHQAAIPSVPRSVADPVTSHRSIVEATLNVLVAARDAGVRRVIYAGSSSVYGNQPTLPKHEDMVPLPLSPYALQKLVGEQDRSDVHGALRTGDGVDAILQRLRAETGSVFAVFGRALGVCSRGGVGGRADASTETASRRGTSLTLPTSSTACSRRATPRGRPVTCSMSQPADGFR